MLDRSCLFYKLGMGGGLRQIGDLDRSLLACHTRLQFRGEMRVATHTNSSADLL